MKASANVHDPRRGVRVKYHDVMSPCRYLCVTPCAAHKSSRSLAPPSVTMGKARTCCHVCAVISALLAVFVGVALTKIPSSHPIIPLPLPSVALNAVGDVLGLLGVDPAPVDYHSMVLGAVKTAGGLSDLDVSPYTGGRDDHALEMLRVLCDDLTRAADSGQLTLLGKLTAQDMIQRSLVNRLQVCVHMDGVIALTIIFTGAVMRSRSSKRCGCMATPS